MKKNETNNMNIIRDSEQDGMNTPHFSMIPLLVSWKIKRCNLEGCSENPTTIISNTTAPVFGMCEKHYQEFKVSGETKLQLEFN